MTQPPGRRRPGRKPNMYDVAELAGVSHQTVSRVLNNHPSVRKSTRERVLRAIQEVNYAPSSIARALATNRSRRIGVLVDSPLYYGPNATLRGLEQAARTAGYTVDAVTASEVPDRGIDSGVEHLLGEGIEALCVIAPRSSSLAALRRGAEGVPTLVFTAETDAAPVTAAVDQRAGACLAVEHLLDLGHREILHLAGPLDWLDARARKEAWCDRLEQAGVRVRPSPVGDWSAESGYHVATTCEELREVTAVFVANDQMALGVLHGLHVRGLRVPEDLSVVGFDDIPEAGHFLPPLTTVRQDLGALGSRAVELLVSAIEGREAPHSDMIAPELVVRESTAPPRNEG